jgi:hypothetical protein
MRTQIAIGTALLALAAPAHAENWDFVLVNKTGKTIKMVEISLVGAADWKKDKREEDQGPGAIKPGDDYTVHFEKEANVCKYDVRMTFDGDNQLIWPAFDVCKYAFGDFALNGELPVVKGS